MWSFVEALGQDLKFTLRSLRHNPGFTLLAVVVTALGIGANTAVLGVVRF
jgi:putative ABC transport system permease protein